MYSPPAISVPEAVRQVLANNNTYLQALQLGIANYTALAEKMKPDIERLIGSRVNLNTVVVAIKRFADTLEEKPEVKFSSATRPKMSLTGSVIDIDFHQKDQIDSLSEMLDDFFEREAGRYTLFQSDEHFSLLADDIDEIRRIIKGASEKFEAKIREDLSKITISLGPDEEFRYHLLSLISTMLYNHQIPVYSAFFTPKELVLVLSEKDAARAYDLIRLAIE